MSEKQEVRFEEADRLKGVILGSVGSLFAVLSWWARGNPVIIGFLALLATYFMTGNRYQWIYIFKKTILKDLLGLRTLLKTQILTWIWEKRGTTVVTRYTEIAKRHPNKKAFIMEDRFITFKQGEELSNQIAWYFKHQGFKNGEVIAVMMETQPEYVFVWLGLAKIKVVSALININLRGTQLIHSLRIAGCKAVIFGDEMVEAIKELHNEICDMPLFQFNSPGRDTAILRDTVPLTSELKEMSTEIFKDTVAPGPKDVLMYIYTSGTTGFPKAAIITHMKFLLLPLGIHNAGGLNSSDVIYDPMPLHHTAGGVIGAGQAMVFGCTVVLRKKFSALNYWSDIVKHGCTIGQYIGEICRYLLSTPPGESDRAHKIRMLVGNGLRPQIWEEFVQRFGLKRVLEFYGATEGNCNLLNLVSKVGAVGYFPIFDPLSLYPLTIVRCDEITGDVVRDNNGKCIECGAFEPGLLLGRIETKRVAQSFFGYADKTATDKKLLRNVKVDGDCYFNTGDLMVRDHFSFVYFKDRTGDTFRWRGENVSTAEVEAVISNLVGLKDALVYGVTIPNAEGKAGMASVADPDRKLDLQNLAKGLKSSLPAYARPLFVRVLPEPPLTSTFKLKKKDLMEEGYTLGIHNDPIYFMDQKSDEFLPLTQKLYDDIVQGVVRL